MRCISLASRFHSSVSSWKKKLKYELTVQNSWVLCVLVHAAMRGSWGARAAGWKCCAFKEGKKIFSRAAESAQWRSSRHSELSGESHGGRRGGRGQRHFPGNHFIHTLKHFPFHVLFTLQTASKSREHGRAPGGLTLKSWFSLQGDKKKQRSDEASLHLVLLSRPPLAVAQRRNTTLWFADARV